MVQEKNNNRILDSDTDSNISLEKNNNKKILDSESNNSKENDIQTESDIDIDAI
jgi:hypothetical protein